MIDPYKFGEDSICHVLLIGYSNQMVELQDQNLYLGIYNSLFFQKPSYPLPFRLYAKYFNFLSIKFMEDGLLQFVLTMNTSSENSLDFPFIFFRVSKVQHTICVRRNMTFFTLKCGVLEATRTNQTLRP
jgi:hypothetical protein